MKKRVVITGLGVLASNGEGKDAYWESLEKGQVGYKPITLFDAEPYLVKQAGEIRDFDPKQYVGKKGLRSLDRSTKLLISVARLAIDDSHLVITDNNTDEVGVAVGSTLGSLKSISDFDVVTLKEGPRYTNPAHFPNTVINSPASQVSIWNNIQGFNTTISTGFTASLDALTYAYDFIQMDRAKVVLAGGVEELCRETFHGFYQLNFLSGSIQDQEFINCPFDARRNGITFGEGACLMLLEDYSHAVDRRAAVLAEVAGFGYYFDPYRINKYNPKGTGMIQSMKRALFSAQMIPEDIDCIFANANSTQAADLVETEAIKDVFSKWAYNVPVTSIKSMVGECFSVSGALSVAASLGSIQRNFIPATVGYETADPDCDLDYTPCLSTTVKLNNIMITNFSPSGSHTCLILKRFQA